VARLKQEDENKLPFEILKLLARDKTGVRWNELLATCMRTKALGSPSTLSKYLTRLSKEGFVTKRVDDTRKGSPPIYAITDVGLDEISERKAGQSFALRKRRLLAIANKKLELHVHPVGLEYRWSKIQEEQNELRPTIDVGRPIDFHAFPVTVSSMILADQNTADDPYKSWRQAVGAESSRLRKLCEEFLDSILQARYDEISKGEPTQNFREEYERIRKAMNLKAEFVVRFNGRYAFNFEREVQRAERERKMDDEALALFKQELLDPSKRTEAVQAFIARILERNEGDITAIDLTKLVADYWKDGGLPTTVGKSEILGFLKEWSTEGITKTDAEEKIKLMGSIHDKTAASADGAIVAIAHLSSLVPPWGTAVR